MPPPLDHARPRSSSETVRRVLAAVVFVPIFFFLVRDLGPVAFFVLVVISGMFAVGEFYRLHVGPASWPWWGWAGVAFTGLFLGSTQWPGLLSERTVLAGTLSSALCMPLFSGKPLKDSLLDGMVLIMGVLYVGLSLGYLLLTRAQPDGTMLIFFVGHSKDHLDDRDRRPCPDDDLRSLVVGFPVA